MNLQKQKEITRICYEEGKLTNEQYEKEIEKIDKALNELRDGKYRSMKGESK